MILGDRTGLLTFDNTWPGKQTDSSRWMAEAVWYPVSDQVGYEFLFVVDGISVDDETAVAVLVDTFDGVLSDSRGLHRLAVSSVGTSALDALERLLLELRLKIPALAVLRTDPDLVGIPDIAERTDRTRQSVQQWVSGNRNADRSFPPPEGCAGRSLVWRWADVNSWLKPLGLDDKENWPTREEAAYLDVALFQWNRARTEYHASDEQPSTQIESDGATSFAGSGVRVANPQTRSLTTHKNLIARIPRVTGSELREWFVRLDSGPAFLRVEERAQWLAEEHGISIGYATAIVHEWEMQRRLRLNSL